MTSAVADAGPLIHLHEAQALRLLSTFDAVLAPPTVWQETTAPARVPEAELVEAGVSRRALTVELDVTTLEPALAALHRGEVECPCLCRELRIGLLLTDDLAARSAAHRLAIRPVGSLGIVVRAFREERLSQHDAEVFLRRLHSNTSLFVTPALVELAIQQLGRPEP